MVKVVIGYLTTTAGLVVVVVVVVVVVIKSSAIKLLNQLTTLNDKLILSYKR